MRHLMLARRYLLHHEQHQAHETESIAKILEYDGRSDNETIIRLDAGQERVYQERYVETTTKRKQYLSQSLGRDIISAEQRAQHERRRPKRTVIQTDLLLRKPQSLIGNRSFQEQRYDLYHETLGKTIQYDETDIPHDILLRKELLEDQP